MLLRGSYKRNFLLFKKEEREREVKPRHLFTLKSSFKRERERTSDKNVANVNCKKVYTRVLQLAATYKQKWHVTKVPKGG